MRSTVLETGEAHSEEQTIQSTDVGNADGF